MTMIYEGYSLQWDLDYVHVRLGAPDLNYRTCACYLDEVGNAPEPGTYVAWAESSAVNYGNSVLDVRTGREADHKPDPKKPHQMRLTREEQDILNGSKGEEMAYMKRRFSNY